MSKKMEEVKEAKVRVVSEAFLQDVKSSSKSFQELLSIHAISPWGAEIKMEHHEVAVDGKCSKPQHTKSAGKVKEEQGDEQCSCFFRGLFNAVCVHETNLDVVQPHVVLEFSDFFFLIINLNNQALGQD